MRLKKLLQGTAFAVFATAAWLGAGGDASAQVAPANVKVDTEKQQMIVKPEADDKEVIISVAKKGKKKGNITFKMSQWDVHDVNGAKEVKVDLSKLSNVKDNFIAVKTEDMAVPFIVRIPAAAKVNVITYNAEKHELDFKAGAKKNYAKAAEKFQYRTPYGSWSEPEALTEGKKADIFQKYQYRGLGVYLRTPATKSGEALIPNNGDYKNVYDAKNIDTKLSVYDSGSFPGKITKLNVAKKAKGPAVPVQYGAGTVTLPKAVEYRILIKNDETGTYEFKQFKAATEAKEGEPAVTETKTIETADKARATKNVKVADLLSVTEGQPATSGAAGVLEVRTAGKPNDYKPKKAKCASNWTRIAIEVTAPFTDEELGGKEVIASASSIVTSESAIGKTTYGDAGVRYAKICKISEDGKTSTPVVTVSYGTSSPLSSATGSAVKGTVRFTNIGDEPYQIVVSKTEVMNIDDLDTKNAKTLAARGRAASKMLSYTNIEDKSYIYIRRAGNQSTKTWAGVYRLFGVVDFPKKK
ncbi:MAG TPA: hypothetical protein DCZ23_04640 [Lachnospiraceae bacterium]|nr:hypothetical protein [Lachnospiraceae bacterium]